MSRFTERDLDPASRLGEILFGSIMVLTVTGSDEATFVFAVTFNF